MASDTHASYRDNSPLLLDRSIGKGYTVDQALEKIGFGPLQINVFTFSGLLHGFQAIVDIQLALLAPAWQCEFQLTNTQLAILTAMFPFGNIIGSTPIGFLCDKYGRKNVVNIANIFLLYYSLMSAFVPSYFWLIAVRFLLGVTSIAANMGGTYCIEFMPVRWRSLAVLLLSLFWTGVTCLLVLACYGIIPTLGWRYLVIVMSIPMAIMPIYYWFLPSSPRFLIQKGRLKEAERVLTRGAKFNCRSLPEGELIVKSNDAANNLIEYGAINENNTAINAVNIDNKRKNKGILELFSKKYRLTTLILALIWFTCGFLGYGTVLITADIFSYDNHCVSHSNSSRTGDIQRSSTDYCMPLEPGDYFEYLITSTAEIPGVLITAVLAELIGRKLTFTLEFMMSGVSFFLLFICTYNEYIFKTIILFIIRACNAGAFNLIYLYNGEVYPTQIRATSTAVLCTLSRVSIMLTGFMAQVLLRENFLVAIGIFGGLGVFTAVVCLMLPYETKGRKLE